MIAPKKSFLRKIYIMAVIAATVYALYSYNSDPFLQANVPDGSVDRARTKADTGRRERGKNVSVSNYLPPVTVLEQLNVTFCSAAKVASTSIRYYFYQIANGTVKMKPNSAYPIHQASWTFLRDVSAETRKFLVTGASSEWTQVVFMKNAVQRFVSGYLDKVVMECKLPHNKAHVHHYYEPFGFSCVRHKNFEEFIAFMESVPQMEGHFAPQTFVCQYQKYPFTHLIYVDQDLNNHLRNLSKHLGVTFKPPPQHAASHKTGSETKMIELFKGRKDLLQRVLNIFEQDCRILPELCNVTELLRSI